MIKTAVILAGGLGTRISEESDTKPKPMIEIGGQPILWHIMKIYARHGINEFIVCLGYKGYMIKEYFANYRLHQSDVTFDFSKDETIIHAGRAEPWKITLVDTGADTMTGGRLKRVAPYLKSRSFCMTYGDGVSDIPIDQLITFHQTHGCEATVTAVQPPGRFGVLDLAGDVVGGFREKAVSDSGFINGGFFVLSSAVLDRIQDDLTVWERDPMESLARDGQLRAYHHAGFWQPMDTLRDKRYLEDLWQGGSAPWKVW